VKKKLLIILAVLAIFALGTKIWYSNALKPAGTGETTVDVPKGAKPDQIATLLEQKQVIKSARAFGWHVSSNDLGPKLQAGRYVLSGKDSATVIATELTEGPKQASQFTVKEGMTQAGIAKLLAGLDVVDEKEFRNLKASDFPQYDFLQGLPENATLEGFLFPETYAIPEDGTSAKAVAEVMLTQFGKELTPEMRSQIKQNGKTIYETVTVASLVEEEVKTEADRKLVAGIIAKRLAEDIRLDIDATVRYALDKPTGALSQSDLDSNDPYNTRKFKGLPPGPIANPGIVSLRAAISPEESDWLFYLNGSDGTTHFAKTNDEHEANKEKYLK
jgi:UPF0755 protein